MSATIRDLPTPLTQRARQREEDARELEELFDRLVCEIARLQLIEGVAASFVEHVRTRKTAGWNGVPMKPDTLPGAGAGFEQLAELVEG